MRKSWLSPPSLSLQISLGIYWFSFLPIGAEEVGRRSHCTPKPKRYRPLRPDRAQAALATERFAIFLQDATSPFIILSTRRPLFQTRFDGTVVAFFGSFIVIVGYARECMRKLAR